MNRALTLVILLITLSFSLDAEAQQQDLSGKYHIQAMGQTDGKGAYLHIWTYGQVIADVDYEKTLFEIIKVGEDTRKGKKRGFTTSGSTTDTI